MSYIRFLILVLCLMTVQLAPAFAQNSCVGLFERQVGVFLGTPEAKISTPESLPAVSKMMKKLDALLVVAEKGKDHRSQIYAQVKPEILEAIEAGKKVLDNKALNQNEVHEFFNKSIFLVDLANNIADRLTEFSQTTKMTKYRSREMQETLKILDRQFPNVFGQVLKKWIPAEVRNFKAQKDDLNRGFDLISIALYGNTPNLKFPFQHKIIFEDGLSTLLDLFKDRERGISYVGISRKEFAPYDGQHGSSKAFEKHDRVHAFTSKYFDLLLFQEFKADNLDKMVALKEKTNTLLQKRIAEYQAIENKALRDAIEVYFFISLHEQSKTYPIGVEMDVKAKGGLEFYGSETVMNALKAERFGKDKMYLIDQPKVLEKALKWLIERTKEDAKTLRSQYNL